MQTQQLLAFHHVSCHRAAVICDGFLWNQYFFSAAFFARTQLVFKVNSGSSTSIIDFINSKRSGFPHQNQLASIQMRNYFFFVSSSINTLVFDQKSALLIRLLWNTVSRYKD
jgi:hypothetical protein